MCKPTNRFAAATAAFLAALAAFVILVAQSGASPPPDRGASAPAVTERLTLHALAVRSHQGDAAATFEFARRVELGIGTDPDPEEAAWWYEVAEEQGYTLPEDVVERLFP